MSKQKTTCWSPTPAPEWLAAINREGSYFNLPATVPLDEQSLLQQACADTGLSDFGDERWREPLRILLIALEQEAQLTLMGRLMARHDIYLLLRNRLLITDLLKRHPEIEDEEITAPMFIIGLPRSGTSILFELLSQDPAVGVPLIWEAMFPCPPPEAATYHSDPRIEQAHQLVTQWSRVVPEFATMHEMAGNIPAECGLIMSNTFISDHLASLHQTPAYNAYYMQADFVPVFEYHRTILKILQWKNPRQCWLLKAPEHQVHLAPLLQVYPDARIIQTHRDPVKCMASSSSLMGALYQMRSDQPFNAQQFGHIMVGEATAQRLEQVMQQRATGVVPAANITDSRYQDLMKEPLVCIENLYQYFNLQLTDDTRQRMQRYLDNKPKGKFGAHHYEIEAEKAAADRALFKRYQDLYRVPSEL